MATQTRNLPYVRLLLGQEDIRADKQVYFKVNYPSLDNTTFMLNGEFLLNTKIFPRLTDEEREVVLAKVAEMREQRGTQK